MAERLTEPGAGRSGGGRLAVSLVDGASAATGWAATDPLKLMLPRPRGAAVWACAATYGGGLVAGDRIDLDLEVGPAAGLFVGTQATTKVYRSTGAVAVSRTTARVADGGLLAMLPEPVSCFAASRYRQEAAIDLATGASLAWLDAVSSGRLANGEHWDLAAFASTTGISRGGRQLVRDALRLDGPGLAGRFGARAACASLFLLGPRCAEAAAAAMAVAAAQRPGDGGLWLACSPLDGGCLLRGAATAHEALASAVRAAIAPLASQLGGDPWRRLASVEIMCT